MISRNLIIFTCLLVITQVTEAELSDKEKVATAAVLAGKEIAKSKKNENPSPKLATIDVTGVDSELKKNIELHMPVAIPECKAERAEVRQFFTTVKKHLRRASRALGYYDSEFVSGGSVVNGCWKLRLRITPGRATKVISQTIKVIGEGSKEKLFLKILKDLPYKKSDVLNHQKYTDFKTQLSEAAQTLGYFEAEFEQHTIRVDPTSYQASVNLVLNTGKRYRYGKITVDQKILSENAMSKYLLLKTGDNYEAVDLINQEQLLQRSGYYKLIKIDVLHDQAKNYQVPVAITLTSKKRNNYKFKIGFGSDTGGRVSAEMNRRWTGKKGRQLKIKGQYAETLSGISLQLINPRQNPEDNTLVYNIDWTKDSNDDVISHSVNIGGKLTRKRSNDWVQSVSIGALIDRTQVEGDDETKAELLLFGVGLEKVKADNLIYPKDGWRIKASVSAAAKVLLSDQDVLQFKLQAKRVKQLGTGRLLARMNVGSTTVDDFGSLPKSLRFFAGGGNSVRGYAYESLGEVNDNGSVIGGRQLLDLSLEYQYPVTDSWDAAVFVDAGNAFNSWSDNNLKVGAGFGARWRSPVGPVRIDIGFPEDNYKDPHLHLSVGSDL